VTKSRIEWTEEVWNPMRGCSRVSPGCEHCYAEITANRFSGPGQPYDGLVRIVNDHPQWTGRIELGDKEQVERPLHWKRPRRVFVNSMSDLFHPAVPEWFIDKVLEVIAACPQHTFQVLTKRPELLQQKLYGYADNAPARELGGGDYLPNLWLGVSVENQEYANRRIPDLLKAWPGVKWVSYEPALGPVDFSRWMVPLHWHWDSKFKTPEDALAAGAYAERKPQALVSAAARFLDWIVMGGESQAGARPMHPAWVRSVRDQCKAAGVPFFFKQWGMWIPKSQVGDAPLIGGLNSLNPLGNSNLNRVADAPWGTIEQDGTFFPETTPWNGHDDDGEEAVMFNVGKKLSGSKIDGREWKEYPKQ